MKWVTRERPGIDATACCWAVRNLVDPEAEILLVQGERVLEVATREGAVAFAAPGAEISRKGKRSALDALLRKHSLERDPALAHIARVVRSAGAPEGDEEEAAPELAGIEAIADGLRRLYPEDRLYLEKAVPLFDALFARCRALAAGAS